MLIEKKPKKILEFHEFLKNAGIQKEDVCIIGSLTLEMKNIRVSNDIDFCIKKVIREHHFPKITSTTKISDNIELILSEKYKRFFDISDDLLIDGEKYHVIYHGFKTIRFELEFAAKTIMQRPKDKIDIINIEREIEKNDFINWHLVRELLTIYQNKKNSKNANHTPKETTSSPIITKKNLKTRLKTIILFFIESPIAATKLSLKKIKQKLIPSTKKNIDLEPIDNPQEENPIIINKGWNSQLITLISVSGLLHTQYYDGKFNRYDILLRYLLFQAIKNNSIVDQEKYFAHYFDMQNKRIGEKNAKRYSREGLEELLANISTKGFNFRHPIPITEEGILVDGAHRLSTALLEQLEYVPVSFVEKKQKIDYGRNWFEKNDFPTELLSEMDGLLKKLLWQNGIYFVAIIWPPAFSLVDEIQQDIEKTYIIKESFDLTLNESQFPDFARAIYAIDDISLWKIEVKISAMTQYDKTIRIIYFENHEPEFRLKQNPKSSLSVKGELLKEEIRNKYKNRIDNYFYDIIFHTGDNYEHNIEMTKIIAKYNKHIANLIQ